MERLHKYEARFCPPQITSYINNLTSSYTDKSNEASMVSASVIMFVLAGLFFNLNLFSGISYMSATLDPRVRLFLTSALSLVLPVMSYLFSEAKNAGGGGASSTAAAAADLSLGAGLILSWMLLVELLRKKVDEICMRGYSGTIQRAGRVAWLGNLVFFNISNAGRKALFGILWILCATRVVQRIAFTELGKRSYAHGKNARLINSYMAKMLEQNHQQAGSVRTGQEALMKSCKYIVMGEEKLVTLPTADGYELNMTDSVVTVGKVWELDDRDKLFVSPEQSQRSKRLCLSFALFKLLRRRFEKLPAVTDEEARDCRDLILNGLYNDDAVTAGTVFQVIHDEVVFLSEYYHSVVPVVLASPSFLLVNYFLVLAVVAVLCLMTVVLCGNGDVIFAYRSIRADNYVLQSGLGNIAICLLIKATNSPTAFFAIVDLSITVLLFIIYFYEEIWDFFVFLLSSWFTVSLLYNFTAKPHWREIPAFRLVFRRITWARSKMCHGNHSFRQFSALNLRWPLTLPVYPTLLSLALRKELVPIDLKQSIIQYLVEHDRGGTGAPLTNGKTALRRNNVFERLSWACKSDSVAEVIFTWHIATGIFEVMRPVPAQAQSMQLEEAARRGRASAIRLSEYCAYLVAFHPELLPDNPEKAERVVEVMKAELGAVLGRVNYYLSPHRERVRKIIDAAADRGETTTIDQVEAATSSWGDQIEVVRNGAKLAKWLVSVAKTDDGLEAVDVWKLLADVWTELIVFVAPSGDAEESVRKGHEDVLVQGGEFITVMWALATHIGLSRPPATVGSTATKHGVSRPAKQSTAAGGGESPTLRDLFDASMRARCSAAS